MHSIVFSGVAKAVRGIIDSAILLIRSFMKQQVPCVWVMNKDIPKCVGNLRENTNLFLQNSACTCLRAFIADKPPGATVFWAIENAGKTYTLAHMEHDAHHRFVHIDWAMLTGSNAKKMFYGQMGLDPAVETKPFGTYLPKDHGVFTTFVFDHFDLAMSKPAALAMIASLSEDSVKSQAPPYNLLIMVNSPANAFNLLTVHGWNNQSLFIKLMGPPYCGYWFSKDLGEVADPRYNALVDQCGTLSPMLSIRNRIYAHDNPVHWLRAARARAMWDEGERLLWQFRSFEV